MPPHYIIRGFLSHLISIVLPTYILIYLNFQHWLFFFNHIAYPQHDFTLHYV